MRVLYHTDGFPYPLTTGRLRHYHFLRQLSDRHDLTLLATVPPNHPYEHDAALAEFVGRVEPFATHRLARGLVEKGVARLRSVLLQHAEAGLLRLCRRAAELHAVRPFDVVLNAHLDSPIDEYLPGVPAVFDVCDAISLRALGELRHAPFWQAPAVVLKYLEARATERSSLRRARYAVFCSQRDAEWAAGIRGGQPGLSVIPNGVDTGYWQRTTRALVADRMVFAGVLGYPPNEDAAFTLLEDVLPLVQRAVPRARLVIAGRDPSAGLLRAAHRRRGCTIVPNVPDLRPILEDAAVFVAPIRFAAGIQNKLLQAMAMELPAITTPVGAAGLLTPDGGAPPIAVQTGARGLADAAIERLERTRHDPAPDATARAYVDRYFRWCDQAARLEGVLLKAIEH